MKLYSKKINVDDSGDAMKSFRILYLNNYHKNRICKDKGTDIDIEKKDIPHTLIFANNNVSKIYLCDKDSLCRNINNNSIIAEILNETEEIYIFFEDNLYNVTEINLEPKYKNEFELLNNEIKKVVVEYSDIKKDHKIKEMFELYSKLEDQLYKITNAGDIDNIIELFIEELETRISICDKTIEIVNKKEKDIIEKILHYKKMLGQTKKNIKSYILNDESDDESDDESVTEKSNHVNDFHNHTRNLIKNIKLYNKNFIYFNE